MSQQNDNCYLKKNESEKNVFSRTGEISLKMPMTPNKKNKKKEINIFKVSLTDKNKYFLQVNKEGMTQEKLFKGESIMGKFDPNEKNEKNSKISKIVNLSPSKIENDSDTTLLVNKAVNDNFNPNVTDSNFTNLALFPNYINEKQIDNSFNIKQYFNAEQYEMHGKNKNNLDKNNKKREVIEDNPKNILENKENCTNSLFRNAKNNNNFNNNDSLNDFNNGNFLFNDDIMKNNINFCDKNQNNNNILFNNIINNKDNFNNNVNRNKKNNYLFVFH